MVRAFRQLQQDVKANRNRLRPETVTFTDYDPARGVPCTGAAMAYTHEALVVRFGTSLFIDVGAGTGGGSVMEFSVDCPAIPAASPAAQSPAGGTEQIVRVQFDFPAAWTVGDANRIYLQGRRVSGTDSTTARILRAVQR
jgi:hypothetical protein